MTRDDIIRMAREAGLAVILEEHAAEYGNGTFINTSYPELEHFAALVAAAEREACATILDRNAEACNNNSMLRDVLMGNALAIRVRGNT